MRGYVTNRVAFGKAAATNRLYLIEEYGGLDRTRICDLLRVKQILGDLQALEPKQYLLLRV